jgi:hypothetical protein
MNYWPRVQKCNAYGRVIGVNRKHKEWDCQAEQGMIDFNIVLGLPIVKSIMEQPAILILGIKQ